jgi:aryl-alcohol dehydrogenase-like predicted oxidoreductase
MNFGEALSEEKWINLVRHAYEQGIRTFLTADVYGSGQADELLARGLAGMPRSSYCLVGAVGHDFYKGQRQGSRGFPRFTDPALRSPKDFADYLRMATEKSLQRCRVEHFDLLLLHNPDSIGYSHDKVWMGMHALRESKLTTKIGVAPGPANGFTLDMILCLERFGELLDWAMIILNPLEPWPGQLVLPAALKHEVDLITRVVDYGGLFHDDVKTNHKFGPHDHRTFRPAGWVEKGLKKMDELRDIAERHNITLLQLACLWNLSQPPVKCVVPTLIQEVGDQAKPIETKTDELASIPEITLSPDEIDFVGRTGDNRGCMQLKGASRAHTTPPEPDRWSISPDLEAVGKRWNIDPDTDLAFQHAERGA